MMTWTCHICKDERPDVQISVRTNRSTLGGVEMGNNVRYCKDRPACAEAAKTFVFVGELVT